MYEQNMTIEDYHKHEALGSTNLKAALKSGQHFKKSLGYDSSDTTASKALGEAIHAFILEPDRFAGMYEESVTARSKEAFLAPVADLMKITPSEYIKFKSMVVALQSCKEFQTILDSRMGIETSFFAELDGKKFKCRTDIITKDGWIVDLKTVGGMGEFPSAPESFSRSFWDFGYDISMVLYKNVVEKALGKKIKGFKFVCVDAKKDISGVKIYTFKTNESKWWQVGNSRCLEAIKRIDNYETTDNYPVYDVVDEEDLELSYQATNYFVEKDLDDNE